MTTSELNHFREVLIDRNKLLLDWIDSPAANDESQVSLVQDLLGQVRDALGRIETKTYGGCQAEGCNDEVEIQRLEVQPVSELCFDCLSKEQRTLLEQEMFLASKIHRALLPQTIPQIEGFDVAVKSIAAQAVGGDYFDFLPESGKSSTRVVIADSMGKGMPAGLLMSNFQGALRILAEDIAAPGALVTRLNQWLTRNVPVTKFITLICLRLENPSAKITDFTYANAGHFPGITISADGSVAKLEATGSVMGVHEEFEFEEQRARLGPGDLALLYTDGVTEASGPDGEMFEESRLVDHLLAHRTDSSADLIDGLLSEVSRFSQKNRLEDDLTVIALRKK
ncbi:MAG: SpoIIE family protein phosphatase [Candidatus Zixiibacteriota bacterium]